LSISGFVPNLSDGDYFDRNYLRDVMATICLGIAFSTLVCFTVFPETSHDHLKAELSSTLLNTSKLLMSLTETFTNPLLVGNKNKKVEEAASFKSNESYRSHLVSLLKENKAHVREHLFFTKCEPHRSKFSFEVYTAIADVLASLSGILSSLDASLRVSGSEELAASPEFQSTMERISEPLNDIQLGCMRILKRCAEAMEHQQLTEDIEFSLASELSNEMHIIKSSLNLLRNYQVSVASNILNKHHHQNQNQNQQNGGRHPKKNASSSNILQNDLLLLNFLILNLTEFTSNLDHLVNLITQPSSTYTWHFTPTAFIPSFRPTALMVPAELKRASVGVKIKHIIMKVYKHLVCTDGVFAFKAASAVLIYQLVLYNQP
jgi:hypothetical protein